MRTVALVISFVVLFVAGFIELKNARDCHRAASAISSLGGAEAGAELPSAGRLDGGAVAAVIASAAGIAALAGAALRKRWTTLAAAVAVAAGALSAVLYPHVDAGRHHLSPRQIALMGLGTLVVGIGLAVLAARSAKRGFVPSTAVG